MEHTACSYCTRTGPARGNCEGCGAPMPGPKRAAAQRRSSDDGDGTASRYLVPAGEEAAFTAAGFRPGALIRLDDPSAVVPLSSWSGSGGDSGGAGASGSWDGESSGSSSE